MSQISAAAVKALRDRTNLPMMDCKNALVETNGDVEQAILKLREKFKELQGSKFAGRETAEGRIAAYVDPVSRVAAIIEVRCESAPVAKGEHFVQLCNDLAQQVALKNPASVEKLLAQPFHADPTRTVQDRINDVIGLIRENMKPYRFKRFEGLCGAYVHHDGTVGTLLQVEGEKADPQILRDICMHITAKNPPFLRREEVSAEVMAKEREIALAQIKNDPKNASKPANILEKIVEGKLKTWASENVLLEQPFVKDDTRTVSQVLQGQGVKLGQVARLKVGELS